MDREQWRAALEDRIAERLSPLQQRELRRSMGILMGVLDEAEELNPRDVLKFMLIVHYLLTGEVDADRREELGDADTEAALAEAEHLVRIRRRPPAKETR